MKKLSLALLSALAIAQTIQIQAAELKASVIFSTEGAPASIFYTNRGGSLQSYVLNEGQDTSAPDLVDAEVITGKGSFDIKVQNGVISLSQNGKEIKNIRIADTFGAQRMGFGAYSVIVDNNGSVRLE